MIYKERKKMDPSGLSRLVQNWAMTFEPEAPALQGRCSTGLSYRPILNEYKM